MFGFSGYGLLGPNTAKQGCSKSGVARFAGPSRHSDRKPLCRRPFIFPTHAQALERSCSIWSSARFCHSHNPSEMLGACPNTPGIQLRNSNAACVHTHTHTKTSAPDSPCSCAKFRLQVQFMLDYLGFPDSKEDVKNLVQIVDWAGPCRSQIGHQQRLVQKHMLAREMSKPCFQMLRCPWLFFPSTMWS